MGVLSCWGLDKFDHVAATAVTIYIVMSHDSGLRGPIVLLALIPFISGCTAGPAATASYDDQTNRTTYETRTYTVSSATGANYGTSASIELRGRAQCRGQGCTPNTVQLIFAATGGEQVSLSGVDGSIVANDARISWSSAEASFPDQGTVVPDELIRARGTFARVDVSLAQLRSVATASSVEGSIGGQPLRIGSGVQSAFQALLRKVEDRDAGDQSGGNGE